jgi:hypothetical protein
VETRVFVKLRKELDWITDKTVIPHEAVPCRYIPLNDAGETLNSSLRKALGTKFSNAHEALQTPSTLVQMGESSKYRGGLQEVSTR